MIFGIFLKSKMNQLTQLSPRETELAERLAWGASVKEAAYALCMTYKTAVNHVQNIYRKTGCNKINQLSAWWFCTHFNISFDLSPMVRSAIASFLLCIFLSSEMLQAKDFCRYRARMIRRYKVECIRIRRT